MDSGASQHMTFNRKIFTDFESFDTPSRIELGNNAIIYAQGKGNIKVKLNVHNETVNGVLTDVLYVPEICKNLFSIGKAISQNMTLSIQQNEATFYHNGKPVMTATKTGSLFYINRTIKHPETINANIAADQEKHLWHQRLGHINVQNLQHMVQNKSVTGLPSFSGELPFCEDCAKQDHTLHSLKAKRDRTILSKSYTPTYVDP